MKLKVCINKWGVHGKSTVKDDEFQRPKNPNGVA